MEDPNLRVKRNARIRALYATDEVAKTAARERHKRWRLGHRPRIVYYEANYRKERPWSRALEKASKRAKDAGREYSLTQEWARKRFTGCCELTKLPFVINGYRANPYSISLDRMDSTKGYTQDNCRFVLWAVNRFKGENTDKDMLEIALAIVKAAT